VRHWIKCEVSCFKVVRLLLSPMHLLRNSRQQLDERFSPHLVNRTPSDDRTYFYSGPRDGRGIEQRGGKPQSVAAADRRGVCPAPDRTPTQERVQRVPVSLPSSGARVPQNGLTRAFGALNPYHADRSGG